MFTESFAHVLAKLAVAGIAAAGDARDLNLPGVWVTADGVAVDTLDDGHAVVNVALVLVAADVGQPSSLEQLDGLLAGVIAAGLAPRDWEAVSIRLPNHSPDALPALRGVLALDWRPS